MLRTEPLGSAAGFGRLAEFQVRKGHSERVNAGMRLSSKRSDGRGIQAAAEEHADRHICNQMPFDRVFKVRSHVRRHSGIACASLIAGGRESSAFHLPMRL